MNQGDTIPEWNNNRILFLLAIIGIALGFSACTGGKNGEVVVYAAQDQEYAEPILKQFTKETGIQVKTLFDSEAVKTVGLANRLLAETNRPQCDVFWGNEEMRTRQLAARGVFREKGVAGFGFRSRRLVANTNLITKLNLRTTVTLAQLTNRIWQGKIALAYPLYGTTAAHFHALRQHWGERAWLDWCQALQANRPLLVDGNSVVVKLVGRGEAYLGLTDSDDILAGQREGLPIVSLPMTGESLLIPNTVAIVRGAPHGPEADRLFKYLQRSDIIEKLVTTGALEGTSAGIRPHLQVSWETLLRDLEATNEKLKAIFLR
ncbi:MAG: substrate-binding domain-containing protein [Verrucomicrobiota bacterium]